jgi:hypothetical protein
METPNIYAPTTGADPLLKEDKAAEFLDVAVKTLQNWRILGTGPRYVKLGPGLRAPVRYRRSALAAYLERCECQSTSEHAVRGAA